MKVEGWKNNENNNAKEEKNIRKSKNGVRFLDLALQYGLAKPSICAILKNRGVIKETNVSKGVIVITNNRSQTLTEIEAATDLDKYIAGNPKAEETRV